MTAFQSVVRSAAWLLTLGALLGVPVTSAQESAVQRPAGIVSNVKIVSDKVEDVSSLEAWRNAFITDEMTDREKALAVWKTVVMFRHQENPPQEFLGEAANVHDPIKTFNVYGYSQCGCAASNVVALARYLGLEARGRSINNHGVAEVYFDGGWRMLDASLICYFPQPDGSIAGVDEIIADIAKWHEQNPGHTEEKTLREFMRNGGWRNGPEVLAHSPYYQEGGWLPALTHGWYSTMLEYDGSKKDVFEFGYSQGYRVNVQLRKGERLTRNWSNQGLHVNALENRNPRTLTTPVGSGDLRYAPDYGDLASGRIGNGTLEYNVPLGDGSFKGGALKFENLVGRSEAGRAEGTALQLNDPAQPGELIIRMPSPYIYLSGQLNLDAVIGEGGALLVEYSDNNGLDWKQIARISSSGSRLIDLTQHVYRRYDYRLKFTINGAAGLDSLAIAHDVQHSQRALPALAVGENTITFSAGPQEGTITIEGAVAGNPEKNLTLASFHPQLNQMRSNGALWMVDGQQGDVTFPVETPGQMTRLRFGAHYRARDKADQLEFQVSFDNGETYQTVATCQGPIVGFSRYVTVDPVPPGTRRALIRFAATQKNVAGIWAARIDADFLEPHGGFDPVQVTYVWEEEGQEKRDTRLIDRPDFAYTINVAAKPTLKSLIVERSE